MLPLPHALYTPLFTLRLISSTLSTGRPLSTNLPIIIYAFLLPTNDHIYQRLPHLLPSIISPVILFSKSLSIFLFPHPRLPNIALSPKLSKLRPCLTTPPPPLPSPRIINHQSSPPFYLPPVFFTPLLNHPRHPSSNDARQLNSLPPLPFLLLSSPVLHYHPLFSPHHLITPISLTFSLSVNYHSPSQPTLASLYSLPPFNITHYHAFLSPF